MLARRLSTQPVTQLIDFLNSEIIPKIKVSLFIAISSQHITCDPLLTFDKDCPTNPLALLWFTIANSTFHQFHFPAVLTDPRLHFSFWVRCFILTSDLGGKLFRRGSSFFARQSSKSVIIMLEWTHIGLKSFCRRWTSWNKTSYYKHVNPNLSLWGHTWLLNFLWSNQIRTLN